mmetsp:Transcript_16206/g.33260  ORF Transcript_16206/g.33260 Transcript_16206/m.33260 type:complete len:99 (+) Transcript_16206:1581-1877(+)
MFRLLERVDMSDVISTFPGMNIRMAPSAFEQRWETRDEIISLSILCRALGERTEEEGLERGFGETKVDFCILSKVCISGNQWIATGKVRPGISSEAVE